MPARALCEISMSHEHAHWPRAACLLGALARNCGKRKLGYNQLRPEMATKMPAGIYCTKWFCYYGICQGERTSTPQLCQKSLDFAWIYLCNPNFRFTMPEIGVPTRFLTPISAITLLRIKSFSRVITFCLYFDNHHHYTFKKLKKSIIRIFEFFGIFR